MFATNAIEITGSTTSRPRLASRLAAIALAGLGAVSTLLGNPAAAAAAVPTHGGSFECYYDAAGNRQVRANLPTMKSNTNGELVYWYAAVYKKSSAGVTFVANLRGTNLAKGFANTFGVITGGIVPGTNTKWVDRLTNNSLTNGGILKVASAGTYQVAGYFWWSSWSTAYTGKWATNQNVSGATTCTFNR